MMPGDAHVTAPGAAVEKSGPAAASNPLSGPASAPASAPASGCEAPSTPARARVRRVLTSAGTSVGELARNLWSGLQLAALRQPRDACATPRQLFLLFNLTLLVDLAYDVHTAAGQPGRYDFYALPALSFWALALLFAAGLVARFAARAQLLLPVATAGYALVVWVAAADAALAVAADHWPLLDRWYAAIAWLPLGWAAAAFGVGAVRIAAVTNWRRRGAIFLAATLLFVTPLWTVDPAARLWVPVDAADAGADGGPDGPQGEQALYGQFDLLDDALDGVAPGQAGVTELFTISFGGDGTNGVFMNEAAGADAVMADAFDSQARAIVLANSQAHPQDRPFATVTALQRVLATMAERMNGDEDVLALFLTSHASSDHHLVVSLPPYQFEDLTPERLRALLDEAGIRYRVIIVSSCYAGGFLEPLAGPDTMVITASAADRTSFGCRDGAQWTDFGRAYFAEALTQTASFEGAFRIASRHIAEREAREGLTPSQPQISVGAGIRDRLQRLETRRGGRILFAIRDVPADVGARGATRFP
jgi:hypothetical protein